MRPQFWLPVLPQSVQKGKHLAGRCHCQLLIGSQPDWAQYMVKVRLYTLQNALLLHLNRSLLRNWLVSVKTETHAVYRHPRVVQTMAEKLLLLMQVSPTAQIRRRWTWESAQSHTEGMRHRGSARQGVTSWPPHLDWTYLLPVHHPRGPCHSPSRPVRCLVDGARIQRTSSWSVGRSCCTCPPGTYRLHRTVPHPSA